MVSITYDGQTCNWHKMCVANGGYMYLMKVTCTPHDNHMRYLWDSHGNHMKHYINNM